MKKLKIKPEETVMLGDKWSTDVLAAKFAKVRAWKVEHRRDIV
jgi:predicted HAD superfamily phosphohydrolase YqeG